MTDRDSRILIDGDTELRKEYKARLSLLLSQLEGICEIMTHRIERLRHQINDDQHQPRFPFFRQ